MKTEKTKIGIGHVIRGLQVAGFGHEEIMAMREAMITGNFKKIEFTEDIYYTKEEKLKTLWRVFETIRNYPKQGSKGNKIKTKRRRKNENK